jgi:signal transduction histidine kinase
MSAGGQFEATGDVALRLRELEARDRARAQLLDLLRGFLNPGEEGLFAAVARALAALRGAAFVTVSELISLQRIRTLAYFSEGEMLPSFEYDVAGTPCENVVARQFYACPERAWELFPDDKYLCELGIESYLGTPLFDREGQPLGNIAILSRAPATDIPGAEELLRVCAVYVSAEIERRRAERTQLERQKMEAVGQLAGGIAHDFNNLLTIILGTAGLMACDSGDPEVQRHLANIQNAAERGTALTRQLLAYSRRQVLEPTVLDVRTVIGELARMLGPILRDDVELVIRHAPDLGQILADRSQFEQVVLNLAINAREAMPQGGTLTIETTNVVLDRIYTDKHVDLRPGRYVLVAVSDTGSGMEPATLQRAFEPFFSTKERGSGLGLATVQGIVRQGGGHVAAHSAPGRGTTFKIYMPRADAPQPSVDVSA